jgi:hypothetical protein
MRNFCMQMTQDGRVRHATAAAGVETGRAPSPRNADVNAGGNLDVMCDTRLRTRTDRKTGQIASCLAMTGRETGNRATARVAPTGRKSIAQTMATARVAPTFGILCTTYFFLVFNLFTKL